ncbi:MAG TPA: SEC-C metal-binding domain-containing protein [Acidimicrobiales bacterium]|nr:SEC-C metal-binding domain-containing protein [Acidimicrobiales bacterium]
MDKSKAELLFRQVPEWADLDDPDDRRVIIAVEHGLIPDPDDEEDWEAELDDWEPDGLDDLDEVGSPVRIRAALLEVLANQIADEDPPFVWETARRLMEAGLDRDLVMDNLLMALTPFVRAAVEDDQAFDTDTYRRVLDQLPAPSPGSVERTLLDLVRRHQPISEDRLLELARAELGLPTDEPAVGAFGHGIQYEYVEDHLDYLTDLDGALALLTGERTVEPDTFCAGSVLTHRLRREEKVSGVLEVGVDLAAFRRAIELFRPGEGITAEAMLAQKVPHPTADEGWEGAKGWLDDFDEGALLAVRVSADAELTIEVLGETPAATPDVVDAVRRAYDDLVDEEDGLPVGMEEIALELVDAGFFERPRPPLSELVEAAGLERRGTDVAHRPDQWEAAAEVGRTARLSRRLDGEPELVDAVRLAIDTCASATLDQDRLRAALVPLADFDAAEALADELLVGDGERMATPDATEERARRAAPVRDFAERLLGVARRGSEKAGARWLLALAHEQLGEVLVAEGHLHLAVEADPEWTPAVDRLAWYLADRGEAAEAARLWRRVGDRPTAQRDLAHLERYLEAPAVKLGRNDPCFCGSGRKYKQCHLGRPVMPSLPDRVGWLFRKAVSYLERNMSLTSVDVIDVALARSGEDGDRDAFERAMSDPLVFDLVLHEGGWFARFLADRGPLLPDDEAILAASWVLSDRSVFEVVDVEPGKGLTLRDLRTAEVKEVRERSGSRNLPVGTLICSRAVPDGDNYQLVGNGFMLRVGIEAEALDLLDRRDKVEIAAYATALERPPTLSTREGEAMVECQAVLEVDDPEGARSVLDALYSKEGDGRWNETHDLSSGDTILRATLILEGRRLTVEAMSSERMDRVLGTLRQRLGAMREVSDRRRPVRAGDQARAGTAIPGAGAGPGPTLDPLAIASLQTQMEDRWLDEEVPALGGVTPRQAAADPTRREALERLLIEFDTMGESMPEGTFTFRTERLRRVLGLNS